ncbi:MAG: alpha-2,8-polysialyltransferase family protein [Oscillospiraceae bacterium]|nr:alpha-2,8-polysialyltransferase family protein [Oscillospiraceae bacterium]
MKGKTKLKSDKMAVAFVAISSFQIIASVNIMADLMDRGFSKFVLFTTETSGILKKIKEQKIFTEVYSINREKRGSNVVYLIKTLFLPFKAIKDQVSEYRKNSVFSRIYCTDCNSLMCALYLHALTLNSSLELHLMEDGARNYCVQFDHYKKLRKIMSFFSLPLYADNFCGTTVFEPAMLPKNNSLKVVKQLKFSENEYALFTIKKIYKGLIFPGEINFGDLIYLNQPFFYGNVSTFERIENAILDALTNLVPRECFKFKNHPKYSHKNSFNQNKLKTSAFEPYFVEEQEKLDHLILVGISSTALFSPKLIFDKEPKVIFLHKIFRIYFENLKGVDDVTCYTNGSFNEAVKRLKNLYKHKSRVIVPETLVQFKKILRQNFESFSFKS